MSTFTPSEAERIEQCIDLLIPHLTPDKHAFAGSIAIRFHLASAGQGYPRRPLNDLDVSVRDQSLSSAVAGDFRVAHYHPVDSYWALVDPNSRLKVDVFSWLWSDATIAQAKYKDGTIPIQSAEDELAKKVFGTRRILHGTAVDPKQFNDARFLLQIVDHPKAREALVAISDDPVPLTIQDAFWEAQQSADTHPELLVAKSFRTPRAYTCDQCVDTSAYPLTPLKEIYKILYSAE